MAATKLARSTKMMPCEICGKDIEVNGYQRNSPKHLTCSIQKAVDQQQQLHRHEGPHYDKWRDSMVRFAERIGGGIPPP